MSLVIQILMQVEHMLLVARSYAARAMRLVRIEQRSHLARAVFIFLRISGQYALDSGSCALCNLECNLLMSPAHFIWLFEISCMEQAVWFEVARSL